MIKTYYLLFFLLPAFTTVLTGQATHVATDRAAARAQTTQLAAKYSLDEAQVNAMYDIQERKQRQLAQIASLKTENVALYRVKLGNVQKGALGSIKRLLHKPEQQALFQKTQIEVRDLQAAERQKLEAAGADATALTQAMLDIYKE